MSFQISITPKERAAGRFVSRVRRALQKALTEAEIEHGTTQSDIARAIGVNRSVISRELRGHKDLGLSRVAEFAWALGRRPSITFEKVAPRKEGTNKPIGGDGMRPATATSSDTHNISSNPTSAMVVT
jgi:hypothetical protein